MITTLTNLSVGAITQITNFGFNSAGNFDGMALICNKSGIFQIGTDGEADTLVETFAMKLGHSAGKRLHFIYLGIETEGTVRITPIVDGVECPAVEFSPVASGRQFMRCKVGRGSKGVYWSFRIENVDGCWFAIDEVHVLPVYLPMWRNS